MAIEMIEPFDQGTQIRVIGVGGGWRQRRGAHAQHEGVQGVEFVCANTDAQALNRSGATQIIQLGGKGLGAGGKPEVGKAAAEEAVEEIRARPSPVPTCCSSRRAWAAAPGPAPRR